MIRKAILFLVLCGLLATDDIHAQPLPTQTTAKASKSNRWLLLCCGLPGDDGHRERLTGACRRIAEASEKVLDVSADRFLFLAGDEQMQQELQELVPSGQVCTKESLQDSMSLLGESLQPNDACWVMLLGHAHLYGARSQYNILGPDIDQADFGKIAGVLTCQEQVFWITTPVSGFWVPTLNRPGRVVISATEAGLEFTGTEMPYALSDLLAGEGQETEFRDADGDGQLSLLDLYLATCLEVHGRFKALERLQTEHSQLDDNGDGRGNEIQEPYLPLEPENEEEAEEDDESDDEDSEDESEVDDDTDDEGETTDEDTIEVAERPLPPPITEVHLDGYLSRQILLSPPAKQSDTVEDTEDSQAD